MVVFRFDANRKIGSGHAMRCMTLGQKLREAGFRILVIGNVEIESTLNRMAELDFEFVKLDSIENSNQEFDAKITKGILDQNAVKPDWLIVDHYQLDAEWENMFLDHCNKLLVFDDLADRQHSCDILVDSGYCRDKEKRYRPWLKNFPLMGLGPRFAMLRDEFVSLRKRQPDTQVNKIVKKILVSYGGTDPTNETSKALEVAKRLPNIHFEIVVGNQSQVDGLMGVIGRLSNVSFHVQTNRIAELLSQSDLVLGAGGMSTWERFCVGVPSIVTTVAENQEHSIVVLAEDGLLEWAGRSNDINVDDLYEKVTDVISNFDRRRQFSESGRRMVDGQGVSRVIRLMMSCQNNIVIRDAKEADCDLYYQWASDPVVRSQSFQNGEISYDQHCQWFNRRVNNDNVNLMIGMMNKNPVGQVRLEREQEHVRLSYSVAADQRGKGIAPVLLVEAIKCFRQESSTRIHAETRFENTASANALMCAGFCETTAIDDECRKFILE